MNINILFSKWFFCDRANITSEKISSSLKRGLSDISKLSISAFIELNIQKKLPLVFATQHGNWQQLLKIKERLNREDEFSPAIFSRVSNNVSAGIISIFTNNNLSYTTISAGVQSFEMGLLESFLQKGNEIAYIYAEEAAPSPLESSTIPGALAMCMNKGNEGNCIVETHERFEIPPKNIFDFMDFLKTNNIPNFETQYFTIKRRE